MMQSLSKLLEKEAKKRRSQEGPVSEEELKDYFENLEFPHREIPIPEKRAPLPKVEPPIAPRFPEKIEKRIEAPVAIEAPKIEEKEFELDLEDLEQGIILSEILSPPKAFRSSRSGEIGRHARLKI